MTTIQDMIEEIQNDVESMIIIGDKLVYINDGVTCAIMTRDDHDDAIEILTGREWESVFDAYSEGYCNATCPIMCTVDNRSPSDITPEIEALAADLDDVCPDWRERFFGDIE